MHLLNIRVYFKVKSNKKFLNFRPPDAVFEDIYDFSDINGNFHFISFLLLIPRPFGRTYFHLSLYTSNISRIHSKGRWEPSVRSLFVY